MDQIFENRLAAHKAAVAEAHAKQEGRAEADGKFAETASDFIKQAYAVFVAKDTGGEVLIGPAPMFHDGVLVDRLQLTFTHVTASVELEMAITKTAPWKLQLTISVTRMGSTAVTWHVSPDAILDEGIIESIWETVVGELLPVDAA